MRGTPTNHDPRVTTLETIIHEFSIVVSKTVLSSHHLMRAASRRPTLDARQEAWNLHVAHLTGHLGSDVHVLPRMHLPRSPTVLVSLRMHPTADRSFVYRELQPLRQLGTADERKALLEDALPAHLKVLLWEGFTVAAFPLEDLSDARN